MTGSQYGTRNFHRLTRARTKKSTADSTTGCLNTHHRKPAIMGYPIIRAKRLGMQVDVLLKEEADSTKALKADSPILNDYF